jgi:hypothetical protein
MTTPLFPSVIAWNVLDGGTDAQDGNAYPGPALQDYAAAVVGAAGIPIAMADLLTTTGKADRLYEVSDGDNRGAKIVWGVPEGASVATWCWWLWPQSAFEI